MGNNLPDATSSPLSASDPSEFWYERIDHNGTSPFIPDGSQWRVFRNAVVEYGADPKGAVDSQPAFKRAVNDGAPTGFNRDTDSLGTTGQPVVVYIPQGTYILQSSLQLYVGTVLMGDPINLPILKAGPNFRGDTLIYGKDPHHDSTTNFYIGIKNIQLDSTNVSSSTKFTILDWSVSQATQLTKIIFNMPNYSTGHTGIAMPEGGSGCSMGDLTFNGGVVGLNMGSQQYEVKSASFNRCTTGIFISGCFACVLVNIEFESNAVGIDVSQDGGHSVTLIDSVASNTGTAVETVASLTGDHALVIENFVSGPGLKAVVSVSGKPILSGSVLDTWVYGNVYAPAGPTTGAHKAGKMYRTVRSSSLLCNDKYVTIPPPTYQEYDLDQFINVKQVDGFSVRGDGESDDTINLNAIIHFYAGSKILFFPQGTYIVTDTLFFPPGSRVVGEAWSAISAFGPKFLNPLVPKPMIKVGNPGDVGVSHFIDMLFTVADVLPGCTLAEVNMAGNSPGDVAFWNSHFRIGGAAGSKVQTNCEGNPASCKAAFLLLHLKPSSSTYIENMWLWTADHDLDGGHFQRNIATGRGMLIEATAATWLHGTASEHNTLYQYNFHDCQNVFVGMQQGEAPYWQGSGSSSLAPDPWTPLSAYGDPNFSRYEISDAKSRMAWYNIIDGSLKLFIYGSGFWTFFSNHETAREGSHCQTNASLISGKTSDVFWYSLNTRSSLNLIQDFTSGVLVTRKNNPGSWDAVVAAYLSNTSGKGSSTSKSVGGLASRIKHIGKERFLRG